MKKKIVIFTFLLSTVLTSCTLDEPTQHEPCTHPTRHEYITGRTAQLIETQAQLIETYERHIELCNAFIQAYENTYSK